MIQEQPPTTLDDLAVGVYARLRLLLIGRGRTSGIDATLLVQLSKAASRVIRFHQEINAADQRMLADDIHRTFERMLQQVRDLLRDLGLEPDLALCGIRLLQ